MPVITQQLKEQTIFLYKYLPAYQTDVALMTKIYLKNLSQYSILVP